MQIPFTKYHALENDFLVVEKSELRLTRQRIPEFAAAICERRRGIGADGILLLALDRKADFSVEVFNADGSWAEKSGNGLRIAAAHVHRQQRRKRVFRFQTGAGTDTVRIEKRSSDSFEVKAELGHPDFKAASLPVRTKLASLVNAPLEFGTVKLPVTCLSVGNPHTVLVVSDFAFDWRTLGADIEISKWFPQGTNVEFVKPVNRRHLEVMEWERGAGATGSSGTGAAAAVCAMVVSGLADRHCRVAFPAGTLEVNWRGEDDVIELIGPVTYVGTGEFTFR